MPTATHETPPEPIRKSARINTRKTVDISDSAAKTQVSPTGHQQKPNTPTKTSSKSISKPSSKSRLDNRPASHPSHNYTKIEIYDNWMEAKQLAKDLERKLSECSPDKEKFTEKMNRMSTEINTLKMEKTGLVDQLKRAAKDYKQLLEAKKDAKIAMEAKFKYDLERKSLTHEKEVSKLELELKKKEVDMNAKEEKVDLLLYTNNSLRKKSDLYDNLAAQGFKAKLEVEAMQNKASVRYVYIKIAVIYFILLRLNFVYS